MDANSSPNHDLDRLINLIKTMAASKVPRTQKKYLPRATPRKKAKNSKKVQTASESCAVLYKCVHIILSNSELSTTLHHMCTCSITFKTILEEFFQLKCESPMHCSRLQALEHEY